MLVLVVFSLFILLITLSIIFMVLEIKKYTYSGTQDKKSCASVGKCNTDTNTGCVEDATCGVWFDTNKHCLMGRVDKSLKECNPIIDMKASIFALVIGFISFIGIIVSVIVLVDKYQYQYPAEENDEYPLYYRMD